MMNGVIASNPGAWEGSVRARFHSLPAPVRDFVDDRVEVEVGQVMFDVARAYAMGDASRLVGLELRLIDSDPLPGQWHGSNRLHLRWTDLSAPGLTYEVRWGIQGRPFAESALSATVQRPEANVTVPGDGAYDVWVVPAAPDPGRSTRFGPFLVDSSPPAAPRFSPMASVAGYRFSLTWSASQDASGIGGYELERRYGQGAWESLSSAPSLSHVEDQLNPGAYAYRVRAVNGAGVASDWSATVPIDVNVSMWNPGPGAFTYGIQSNYTGFLHAWPLDDPGRYLEVSQIPAAIRDAYTGPAHGIEVGNETLRGIVQREVGSETNTLTIAKKLFVYLYDHADYDSNKATGPDTDLQRAGLTLDRGLGICGDLAVLYITLLRIAGVAARPMHGYLDNPEAGVGGFHMWVEAYVGPEADPRPWLPVDVSGVTGAYQQSKLYPSFGVFNPDYLALGTELDYERYPDNQWNTWARTRAEHTSQLPPGYLVADTTVTEYEVEYGRLYFDVQTDRTQFVSCHTSQPDQDCGLPPAGFSRYYEMKALSKKKIDYGYTLATSLPACLRVELRYPFGDAYGAITKDQAAVYEAYEAATSPRASVGAPDADGWITFQDGTRPASECFQP